MPAPSPTPPPALLEGGLPHSTWQLVRWIWQQPVWGPLVVIGGHLTLLAMLLALFFPQTGGQDLYWYLATGRLQVAEGLPGPATDPFSWSAQGAPWLNHEWLFTYGIYKLYAAGGFGALVAAKYLLLLIWGGAFVWMANRVCKDPYLGLLTALTSIPLLGPHCDLRPQLVTYTLVTLLLATWFEPPKRPWLALAIWAGLLLLWVQLHGAMLYGVALLTALLVVHGITKALPWRVVIAGIAVAILVPLANPYGAEIYRYAFSWLTNPDLKASIMEWNPIYAVGVDMPEQWVWMLWPPLTFAVIIYTGSGSKMKWSPADWLLLVIYLLPLMAIRHTPLAHIAFVTWWYHRLANGLPWLRLADVAKPTEEAAPVVHVRIGARLIAEGLAVLSAIAVTPLPRLVNPLEAVPRTTIAHLHPSYQFPSGAVLFITQFRDQMGPRVFNFYDWGGYLLWRFHYDEPSTANVFIDGRLDTVYPAEVIYAYADMVTAQMVPLTERPSWKQYEPQIDVAILPASLKGRRPAVLIEWEQLPDWALVYEDTRAAVLIRRTPENAEFIAEAQGLTLPVPADPQAHYGRAVQVLSYGDAEGARREFEAAIALDPTYAAAHHWLGVALLALSDQAAKAGDADEAKRLSDQSWEEQQLAERWGWQTE